MTIGRFGRRRKYTGRYGWDSYRKGIDWGIGFRAGKLAALVFADVWLGPWVVTAWFDPAEGGD